MIPAIGLDDTTKKAAITRRQRHVKNVIAIARRLLAENDISERSRRAIRGRGLGDPESIKRGIGSECWQDLLGTIERLKAQDAA
jgi:hypothetical protein